MTLTMLAYFPSPPRGVWYLGPVPVRAYALCIIAGIVVALLIGDRRWQARGGERGVIYDIALWAVPFGLVGGRLYHLITDWRTYFGDAGVGLEATLRIWDGGLGIWGAVALGGVGAWIGCRRRGIPLPAFGDAIAPGIVLAQAIGRLGNYFNQELYGRETTLPWGMEVFWRQDTAGVRDPHLLDGVSTGELYKVVQPTFLYELLWNVLVFVLLIYLDRRFRIGHGRLFALYVAGYCVGRFCIELLRDDVATHIAGIRVNSFTATFLFIGAVVYVILAPKGREDPVTLGGEQREEKPLEKTRVPEPEKELVAVASTTDAVARVTVEPEPEPAEVAAGVIDAAAGSTAEEGSGTAEAEPETAEAEPEAEMKEPAEDTAEAESETEEPAEDTAEAEPEAETKEPAEDTAEAESETEEPAEDAAEAESETKEPAEDAAEAESETEPVEPEATSAEPHRQRGRWWNRLRKNRSET